MIHLLFFCCCLLFSLDIHAQELAANLHQNSAAGSALQQWQNGVDNIHGQVDVLLKQNDTLTQEYNKNKAQEEELKKLIAEQRQKIDALNAFLKQRAGNTDQQMHVDQLNDQLKMKRLQHDKTLLDYKTQHQVFETLQKRLEEKRLKISAHELHQGEKTAVAMVPVAEDPELDQLRKELEMQQRAEAQLESQIDALVSNASFFSKVNQLQDQLTALESQKTALLQRPVATGKQDKGKYFVMQAKKEELEVKIRAFEKRIEVLKSLTSLNGSWVSGRQELVHAIVQKDARNKRLINEIKELRENIVLLKSQIGVLEKRVLFSNKK